MKHVESLREYLLSNRRAYLDTRTMLRLSNVPAMTDQEREKIDYEAKVIIKTCMGRIDSLDQVKGTTAALAWLWTAEEASTRSRKGETAAQGGGRFVAFWQGSEAPP